MSTLLTSKPMNRWALFLVVFGLLAPWVKAQSTPPVPEARVYWVLFADKGDWQSIEPSSFLSPEALTRREAQGVALDYTDYPVRAEYVSVVSGQVAALRHRTRWFNGVSAWATPQQVEALRALPFVADVRPVTGFLRVAGTLSPLSANEINRDGDKTLAQLAMLGLPALHDQGLTGKGIRVAVFDDGFKGVDKLPPFAHLVSDSRILMSRDYVKPGSSVFLHGGHGTNCLSLIAANEPGKYTGAAPDATFLLFRTEDGSSETPAEEDNWVAAAEVADSAGAMVFSTSLGYTKFDNGVGDYFYENMDGRTAMISKASLMAARKGIFVVSSAGNEGNSDWYYISAPADADSVVAVGAVTLSGQRASFSSNGPTADGRLKPDVMAPGQGVYVVNNNGSINRGDGTSYAGPLITGLVTCLLQGAPNTPNMALYYALIQSGSHYDRPDNQFGYGIPNGPKTLKNIELVKMLSSGQKDIAVVTNAEGGVTLLMGSKFEDDSYRVQVLDNGGRVVYSMPLKLGKLGRQPFRQAAVAMRFASGKYTVVLQSATGQRLTQESAVIGDSL